MTAEMRFTIDPWDPSYSASAEIDLVPTQSEVNTEVEAPDAEWRPVAVPDAEPAPIVFIDGVRRVEARGWIESGPLTAEPALFASYAAGSVRCDERARVVDVEVRRGVWSPSPSVADVDTRAGTFRAGTAIDASPERLSLALQDALGAVEVAAAERARRNGDELVVVDGPLRGRQHLPHTVGLVKTHHVSYLPAELERVVAMLGPGERTPVFALRSSWSRFAWYVRLPGPPGGPWAGVVRCEAAADLAPAAVVDLADRVTARLPRYASLPHKDHRAPQNLFPIAGLERELRRRLGDPAIVYRALRTAATTAGV